MKYYKICPRCGSIEVTPIIKTLDVSAFTGIKKYKCNKCKLALDIFPEISEEDLLKNKNDRKK